MSLRRAPYYKVAGADTRELYSTADGYHQALEERALVPHGFRFAVASTHFTPVELGAGGSALPINLAAILAPAASRAWAAVLTRNRVTGAPVEIVRSHRGRPVRGILINNKVANVCAPDGVAAARAVVDAYDAAQAAGRGAVALDGRMIDMPVVRRAQRTLTLARRLHQAHSAGNA